MSKNHETKKEYEETHKKTELRKYFLPNGIVNHTVFARCSWLSRGDVSVKIPYIPARQRSAPQNQSGA